MSTAAKLMLALAILVAGMVLGIKWEKGQQALRDQVQAQQATRELARRLDRGDASAAGFEKDRERIRTEYVTVTETVDHVVEKPFYSDQCLDADGLRIVRAAAGAEAAGEPAPAVPGPGAAR